MVAKEPDMVHDGLPLLARRGKTETFHHISCILFLKPVHQSGKLAPILGVEPVVGVEPEDPVSHGMAQTFIACGGEIIDPGKLKDTRPEPRRDLPRPIGRTGVDHDPDHPRLRRPIRGIRARFASSFRTIKQSETFRRARGDAAGAAGIGNE